MHIEAKTKLVGYGFIITMNSQDEKVVVLLVENGKLVAPLTLELTEHQAETNLLGRELERKISQGIPVSKSITKTLTGEPSIFYSMVHANHTATKHLEGIFGRHVLIPVKEIKKWAKAPYSLEIDEIQYEFENTAFRIIQDFLH